jgi:hypothetical protein
MSWALEEPPVAQLLKNFPVFYETEISLLCSQEHATGPSPEPAESSTHHPNLFL